MSELAKNLSSLSWWVSVVVVGLVLNIGSAYLKPWLDRLGGSLSTSLRDHNERTRARRAGWIELLRTDHHAQLLMYAREARLRQRGNQFLLLSILLVMLGALFAGGNIANIPTGAEVNPLMKLMYGSGAFAFYLGYWSIDNASICGDLLRLALKDYPLPFAV